MSSSCLCSIGPRSLMMWYNTRPSKRLNSQHRAVPCLFKMDMKLVKRRCLGCGSAYTLIVRLERLFLSQHSSDACGHHHSVTYMKFVDGSFLVFGNNVFTSHQQRFPPKLPQYLGFVNKKHKCAIESELPFQLFTRRFSQQ